MKRDFLIYAVDFDGTLCEHKFPDIGSANTILISFLIRQRGHGAKIILWTNRVGEQLTAAVMWSAAQGLEFDAVNENLPEVINHFKTDSRKVYADIYIDDRSANKSEYQIPYTGMTEEEAISCLELDKDMMTFDAMTGETCTFEQVRLTSKDSYKDYLADNVAIRALQEISSYRAIGTIEKSGKAMMLPCAVGDTVYVRLLCECINTHMDSDTGFIECPFEQDCEFDECANNNERIVGTTVESIFNNGNGWCCSLKNLCLDVMISDFGRTVFLTKEELEASITEGIQMTENEAIQCFESRMKDMLLDPTTGESIDLEQVKQANEYNYKFYLACKVAVKVLQEIQQYK